MKWFRLCIVFFLLTVLCAAGCSRDDDVFHFNWPSEAAGEVQFNFFIDNVSHELPFEFEKTANFTMTKDNDKASVVFLDENLVWFNDYYNSDEFLDVLGLSATFSDIEISRDFQDVKLSNITKYESKVLNNFENIKNIFSPKVQSRFLENVNSKKIIKSEIEGSRAMWAEMIGNWIGQSSQTKSYSSKEKRVVRKLSNEPVLYVTVVNILNPPETEGDFFRITSVEGIAEPIFSQVFEGNSNEKMNYYISSIVELDFETLLPLYYKKHVNISIPNLQTEYKFEYRFVYSKK